MQGVPDLKFRPTILPDTMKKLLFCLKQDLEPSITEAGQQLMAKLNENDKELVQEMSKIENDDTLMQFTKAQLQELWKTVADQSAIRSVQKLRKTVGDQSAIRSVL